VPDGTGAPPHTPFMTFTLWPIYPKVPKAKMGKGTGMKKGEMTFFSKNNKFVFSLYVLAFEPKLLNILYRDLLIFFFTHPPTFGLKLPTLTP
jgi:hypothetical protein